MATSATSVWLALAFWLLPGLTLLLGGCASRPVNPPIAQADQNAGYRFFTRPQFAASRENLVILAFSGGGTRAAAFSYGVLEFLRNTEVVGPRGKSRLLDHVSVVTGVSGGSFTALAYGLYGERLFDDYEQTFLKRDVQGTITRRTFNPAYWPSLWSGGWGRSELAADLYDEILFHGATFGDLNRGQGPFIVASATDITTGARLPFTQATFDVLCSDLNAVRLSRAAAASSAVELMEALHLVGLQTPLDQVRHIAVFVVNSLSVPKTEWDKSESPPGMIEILVKAAGVPIDHYSYEATELLKDSQARWRSMGEVRRSAAFAANKDAAVASALRTPDATIYAIDVSFARLEDREELAYLNELPTSFSLPPEAVDRLRAAAGKIIMTSPDFQRLLKDAGATIVTDPQKADTAAATAR